MAYSQVPERTTSDTNAPGDINQLQDNFDSFLNSTGAFTSNIASTHRVITINAGGWDYPTSDPAELDTDSGTNGTIKRQLFDDTTEETVIQNIIVPYDIDTTGRIVFEVYGYSSTAAASQSVRYKVSYSPVTNGESWDASFSTLANEINVSGTQDYIDANTFSTVASNLSISANDEMRIKLSRTTVLSGTTVSGNYGVTKFNVRFPR
jgi:hypothetical protein